MWQYSTAQGSFSLLHSLSAQPEIEGFTKSRWNTFAQINCFQDANLTCLEPGVRLRFARKTDNGTKLDSSLQWNLEEGINFGKLMFWPFSQETCFNTLGYMFAQKRNCAEKSVDSETKKNKRKNRKLPELGCDGVENSKAKLNKCGYCYLNSQDKEKNINECGTCFDQPCCASQNFCGHCSDEKCDTTTTINVLNGPLVDLACNKSLISLEIECFEECPPIENCEIASRKSLEIKSLTSNTFEVVFKNLPLGLHDLKCGLLKSSQPLQVVNSAFLAVKNVTTRAKNSKTKLTLDLETEVTIPLKNLRCFVHKKGLLNRQKAVLTLVKKMDGKRVHCEAIKLPAHEYEVGLSTNLPGSLKSCLSSTSFSLSNDKAPMVTEAFLDSPSSIKIQFDTNIKCTQESCANIFQDFEEEQAACECKGDDKLLFRFANIMDFVGRNSSRSLIFREENGIYPKGSDPELAKEVEAGIKLRVRRRGGKKLKKVSVFHGFLDPF